MERLNILDSEDAGSNCETLAHEQHLIESVLLTGYLCWPTLQALPWP